MREWKEYKLGEIAEVQTGPFGSQLHMSDYKKFGTPIITVEHLKGNRISHENVPLVSDEDKKRLIKYTLKEGDIVFSRVGSVDRCSYVSINEDGWMFSGRLLRVRSNPQFVDSKFLAFYFGQEEFKETIRRIAVGATMPSINTTILSEVVVNIPSIKFQKRIARILNSLDDKINLLTNQNNVLEQLAETLFRQWFIEEANTNEEVTLEEYVNTVNGYSYKSSELNPSENALVTLKSFNRNGSFRLDGFKEFTGPIKQHQTVKQGDLIVSHTDITQEAEVIGNPALVIEDPRYKHLVITMDMVKVVPKDDRLSIPFLYFLMRTPEFKFHCLGCSNGTTVLHMSKSAIPTFSFPKPDFDKVKIFTEYAGNLLEKTFKNHAQIRSLNNFRDAILPKLMSGEATINE
jgi:type I restriction enzyme S subunit